MSKSTIIPAGTKFNKLTVIKLNNIKQRKRIDYRSHTPYIENMEYYLCSCECGNQTIVLKESLKNGTTKSCGCLHTKHSLEGTRLYGVWSGMKNRCKNNNPQYKHYNGRGISVCEEWKHNFKVFYDWAIKNGYNENAAKGQCTIDRIDVNGNYCPENCRWINCKQQQRNKTNNHLITYMGETMPMVEWCEKLNLDYKLVKDRINKQHWEITRAFNQPKGVKQ